MTTTGTTNKPSVSTSNSSSSGNSNCEFHLCALCSHCLVDPVTLTCGCSFCKLCWAEYNQEWPVAVHTAAADVHRFIKSRRASSETTSSQASLATAEDGGSEQNHRASRMTTKRKLGGIGTPTTGSNNNESARVKSGRAGGEQRCFTCLRSHEHNKLEFLKPNVVIGTLVDRLWHNNVEIRRLRDDIRAYVCFCIEEQQHQCADDAESSFDVNLFEYLFNSAYTLG